MTETKISNDEIRNLANATNCDDNWFFNASQCLSIPLNELKKDSWHKQYWNKKWGQIDDVVVDNKEGILWKRPDGSGQLVNLDNKSRNEKIIRFALLGELTKRICSENKRSYIEVGLEGWKYCKVLFNGSEPNNIVSADAVFGLVKVLDMDKSGVSKFDHETGSAKTLTLAGNVEIIIENKTRTFF